MKKIKIAVLGANGQLGQEFKYIHTSYEYMSFDFYDRNALDITDPTAVKIALTTSVYDYVINCAAYTAVDKAESEQELCFAINHLACKNITDALQGLDTRLVHFSSDYVYHTYSGFPLQETDVTAPQGIYAQSKLQGDDHIRTTSIPALIIRTSWVVSVFGHNFVKTMIRLGKEKSEINVVNDQFGAPTNARHLAKVVLEIITQTETNSDLISAFNDTYNFANEGIITWYDLAQYIMKQSLSVCKVSPIPTTAYPTPAKRPHWSVMSKKKINHAFQIDTPHWRQGIQEIMEELASKN
jgi:dTDP-4-dehydrorhamnose reductase